MNAPKVLVTTVLKIPIAPTLKDLISVAASVDIRKMGKTALVNMPFKCHIPLLFSKKKFLRSIFLAPKLNYYSKSCKFITVTVPLLANYYSSEAEISAKLHQT